MGDPWPVQSTEVDGAALDHNLAIISVGYADGYSRALGHRAQALIRGRSAPIAGPVCMNIPIADAAEIPKALIGDEVVLTFSR